MGRKRGGRSCRDCFLTWFFVLGTIGFSCFMLVLYALFFQSSYFQNDGKPNIDELPSILVSAPFVLGELINVCFGLYMVCYPWAYMYKSRWVYFAPFWTSIFLLAYGGIIGGFFRRLTPHMLSMFMMSAGLQFLVYAGVVMGLSGKGKGEKGCVLWPIDPETRQISCC